MSTMAAVLRDKPTSPSSIQTLSLASTRPPLSSDSPAILLPIVAAISGAGQDVALLNHTTTRPHDTESLAKLPFVRQGP